jgi:hypothetical protein
MPSWTGLLSSSRVVSCAWRPAIWRSGEPIEALAAFRHRPAVLSARHAEHRLLMELTAQLYAVSRATLYRLLHEDRRPKDAYRSERGLPRAMPSGEIERLRAIVAAMKLRTTNRKGAIFRWSALWNCWRSAGSKPRTDT